MVSMRSISGLGRLFGRSVPSLAALVPGPLRALMSAGPLRALMSAGPLAAVILASPLAAQPAAQNFETKAEQAILIDYDSNTVLFEKNADKQFPPASLAKMMTVTVLMDDLKAGKLTLDSEFSISEHAWRTGGAPSRTSSMFAPINSKVRIEDLLHGIMIQSANDGAIAVAEGLAGTELAFSDMMNKKARDIGLTKSFFRNSTGLPDPDQKITARDFAKLAAYMITTHPDYYKIYGKPEFTFNKIRQYNRNPLLNDGIGADGLKTGYIKDSGYNIVGSALQSGQRLILVMGGMKSEKERGEEAKKLMEWGFRSFEQITLYKDGEKVGDASVFGGAQGTVPLVGERAIKVLVPRGNRDKLRARVVYMGPVKAPVEKGQKVGKLQVLRDEKVIQETALVTDADVAVGTLQGRAFDAVAELVTGFIRDKVGFK